MQAPSPTTRSASLYRTLARALNLRQGLDHPEEIDADIRRGVEALGTNLWVLIFAILIASVGLNVNSTAVIIGAMLISPLMGPIIGIGYGLAIRDFELLRVAARNLAVFTAISLTTSTLYFSLSPLELPGSELLARTSPTLWDVLIAFFGGSAGIIALTRHNVSTVVPGVAIATALMPPLCTAGFAISQGRWDWMGGALYLFAINGVFIAYSTLLFVKLMKLRTPQEVKPGSVAKARWLTALTLLAVIVPSVYLAWRVVTAQDYAQLAKKQIEALAAEAGVVLLGQTIDAEARRIELTVAGEDHPARLAAGLQDRLHAAGYPGTRVMVRSASGRPLDVGGIKREIESGLASTLNDQTRQLREEVDRMRRTQQSALDQRVDLQRLSREIEAQYPKLGPLIASLSLTADREVVPQLVLTADWGKLSRVEQQRLQDWLAVRLEGRAYALGVPLAPTAAKPPR